MPLQILHKLHLNVNTFATEPRFLFCPDGTQIQPLEINKQCDTVELSKIPYPAV